MTSLSIQQKIDRLPLDALLSQCAKTNSISDEEIEAVCGLYQAKQSVSLEQNGTSHHTRCIRWKSLILMC
jgi:hypothetical protein